MAHLLAAAGQRVDLLALIDTIHPKSPVQRMNLVARLARLREEGWAYVLDGLRRRSDGARKKRELRAIARCLARGEMVPFDLRDLHLVQNFRRAAAAYDPKPWPGRATLFRAAEIAYIYRPARPAYGWEPVVLGGIDVVGVSGNHHTLLQPKNVGPLAGALERAIERAVGLPTC
jgi:thioesterase domain-containing protein